MEKQKEKIIPMKFNVGLQKYEPDLEKLKEDAERELIVKKITEKREFSELPEKDVEFALSHFIKRQVSDEEKIKLTRELLHKVFSSFTSRKLLSPKDKSEEWILRKHFSTRERLPYYKEIYRRIFKGFERKVSVVDLGAGINGFSYGFFKEAKVKVDYIGIEAIGQLVSITNDYFKKKKINGKAVHLSLFETDKIKELINKTKSPRIIFLFKTIDSMEMLSREYSLKLIKEIAPFVDLIAVSFAVKSMVKRKRFKVNRRWIVEFIENNFKIIDNFEFGGEKYICFSL